MKRIVIAGAGISGLALAWGLRQHGIAAQVLESSTRPGGKLQSDRAEGFLVESGPQSFDPRNPVAASLLAALGLQGELVPASPASRRRCVLADGVLREVPTDPFRFAACRALPLRSKARILFDLALPRGGPGEGSDESIAEFGRRRFGDAAPRLLFPLVPGLYSGDPEIISHRAAFPVLSLLEREHRSVILGALRGVRASLRGPRLATLRGGMGALPEALAARLGPQVRFGVAVVSVRPAGSGWRVAVQEGGARSELDADAVVLALPAHAAAPVLDATDAGLAALVGSISYAPVAIAQLGYPRGALPRLPAAHGFYTPASERSRLLGGVFTSEVFPSHAPQGQALVTCRMAGARDPDLLGRSDADLLALAEEELRCLLGAAAPPSFRRLVRHPRALPQYTLGHAERVAAIEAATRRYPGLTLTGNAYRGLGILDCLREAQALAGGIAQRLNWPFSAGQQSDLDPRTLL